MKFVVSFLLFFAATDALATCHPDINSCHAYTCLANELRCDRQNYLIKFGEHYCQQFLKPEVRVAFTKLGAAKVAKIRLCLQKEAINDSRLNCSSSKALSQEHHLKCYVSSGFCELSLHDKLVILGEVYGELQDPDFVLTTKEIALACGERWL